ncbi:hypothetical protein M5J14_18630 [Lysinibacillus sp. OL1_EC]|uniref:hypothetical protein n=1 Tax=unclassified Lysinibacillus TaxID=2636778 RepID=UPI00103F3542|nr:MULTISPECIES: hypothetical protein [unclassified Lysinibacillus]MCM0626515.1 hypothetical protein [Lysinibacillus sp. OL1_EC]MCS5500890.1 hypothetical protein [Lysinibacillus sp. A4]TBV85626.1 hypothetical protein EW028_19555 [Lysinibacillus sp. OL1]WGT40127.1 hypothetical protein QH639_04920 [Lysinibacillus sp. 1 U-2021]
MKKSNHIFILIGVVLLALFFVNDKNLNLQSSGQVIQQDDPFSEFRSDGTQTDLETIIKKETDQFMYENYGSVFKTTWYDSISASSTMINKHGKYFVVQSKSSEHNAQAKQYAQGLLSYFNMKTLDKSYKVDSVLLIDQDYNILFKSEIVKW